MRFRHPFRRPRFSLRTRLSLSVVLIALTTTFGIVATALYFVRASMQAAVASEQYQRVVAIADAIDQKFASRRTLLKTLAESLAAGRLGETAALQPFIKQHPAIKEAFDNFSVIDRAGNVVANFNSTESIGRLNVADRPYFVETLRTSKGVISQPIKNRFSGLPQVVMTAPVFDGEDRIAYVVTAQINLNELNFLGELANIKFGKTGYVFITNTEGIVIDSPRKSRVLKHFDAEGGQNEATTRAVAGFEGTTEAVNRQGVHVLYAFKQTRQTNWVIGGHYPREEAFAPIRQVERLTGLGALLLSLLVGGLSLWAMRRQLAPLGRLHDHMRQAQAAARFVPAPQGYAHDEVGELARTFDQLMQHRHDAEQRLTSSEKYLRDVLSHAGDAFISIDRAGAVTEWNHQAEVIFGWTRAEVLGHALDGLIIPPGMRDAHRKGMELFVRTGDGPVVNQRIEIEASHRDGRAIPIELSIAAVDMGDHFVANAFLRDITPRKDAEDRIAASRKFLQDIADNMPSLIAHVDQELRYTFVNAKIQNAHPGEALLGKSMREVRGDAEFAIVEPWARKALTGETVTFEKNGAPHGMNAHRCFEITYIPDRDLVGHVTGFYSMSFDVTERKAAEVAVAASAATLRGVTDNLPALVSHIDQNECFTFANAAFRDWFERDPADMLGKTLREAVGEEVYAQRQPMLRRAFGGERVEFDNQRLIRGQLCDVRTSYVPDRDGQGRTRGVFSLSIDITELKAVQRQLIALARADTLTGLPNRLAFNESLPVMLARARRSGDALAVMFLDIDHFKTINDTLGHAAGDEVLVEFSRRLRASVRTTDLVARLAGDEFVVVLESLADRGTAEAVARKIVEQVSRPSFDVQGRLLAVTTSIGIVLHHAADRHITPEELLARADAALYGAKASGRNTFQFAL